MSLPGKLGLLTLGGLLTLFNAGAALAEKYCARIPADWTIKIDCPSGYRFEDLVLKRSQWPLVGEFPSELEEECTVSVHPYGDKTFFDRMMGKCKLTSDFLGNSGHFVGDGTVDFSGEMDENYQVYKIDRDTDLETVLGDVPLDVVRRQNPDFERIFGGMRDGTYPLALTLELLYDPVTEQGRRIDQSDKGSLLLRIHYAPDEPTVVEKLPPPEELPPPPELPGVPVEPPVMTPPAGPPGVPVDPSRPLRFFNGAFYIGAGYGDGSITPPGLVDPEYKLPAIVSGGMAAMPQGYLFWKGLFGNMDIENGQLAGEPDTAEGNRGDSGTLMKALAEGGITLPGLRLGKGLGVGLMGQLSLEDIADIGSDGGITVQGVNSMAAGLEATYSLNGNAFVVYYALAQGDLNLGRNSMDLEGTRFGARALFDFGRLDTLLSFDQSTWKASDQIVTPDFGLPIGLDGGSQQDLGVRLMFDFGAKGGLGVYAGVDKFDGSFDVYRLGPGGDVIPSPVEIDGTVPSAGLSITF